MNIGAYLRDTAVERKSLLARSSDLVLAALVVAIIALMIIPLPRPIIDSLVAVNMTIGVMLVLMGIYVSSALQFTAFPSVLLISTLFRLALSVATTRMILLHGNAGHIIETFGSLVAGGNLVVGLVVFLIITLVQFLVIAKGAERVAEVGARFSLDAMPGKQLSIDSDLRSGLIDKHEARNRRRELELESKLHGSMDGAMKFVKGDAIAGIVIIVVNLLGGLAIGVFQLGMSGADAMQKYSILTIGDGLVAQIPALLGAMAAGLIVTRSTDSETDRHLGESIQKQFAAIPRVMLIAGALCLVLALVPGFPSLVFVLLGSLMLLLGGVLVPRLASRTSSDAGSFGSRLKKIEQSAASDSLPDNIAALRQAVPLALELPRDRVSNDTTEAVEQAVQSAVRQLELRSGVPLPAVRFHWLQQPADHWRLHAFEVPILTQRIAASLNGDGLAELVVQALNRHTSLFLGIQESTQLLALAGSDYPDIVKEIMRSLPIQSIAAILRNLADEDVSIRNLRAILEALIAAAQQEKDVGNLTEFARIALARQTCYRYAEGGTLRALALSSSLEEHLLQAVRSSAGVQQLSLDPPFARRLHDMLVTAISEHRPQALITNVQLRRHLRALLAGDCIDTPVLSYNELMPTLELDIVHQFSADAQVTLKSA